MRQTVHSILLTMMLLLQLRQAASRRLTWVGWEGGSEPRCSPGSGLTDQRVVIVSKAATQIGKARELVRPYIIESARLEPPVILMQKETQRLLGCRNLQAEDFGGSLDRPLCGTLLEQGE